MIRWFRQFWQRPEPAVRTLPDFRIAERHAQMLRQLFLPGAVSLGLEHEDTERVVREMIGAELLDGREGARAVLRRELTGDHG